MYKFTILANKQELSHRETGSLFTDSKTIRESVYFICQSTKLQIIDPQQLIEFDPFNTDLTCGMTKSDSERKLQKLMFRVNKSLNSL